MAQLSNMMSGLSLGPGDPSSPSPAARPQSAAQGNRLPTTMKKYMNPHLVRPPNTGLASYAAGSSSHAESARGPLLKLAGINVESPPRSGSNKYSSPKTKGKSSLSQHTAHGLHGPAHSTTGRALSSAINPAASHQAIKADRIKEWRDKAEPGAGPGGIGAYDGGLEADEEKHEAVTGEAAKVLEMDSGSGTG